jgi:hypothetical protein
LPPHKALIQAAFEGAGAISPGSGGANAFGPVLPTVGARYGVLEGFDVGARLSHLTGIGADAKVRLVKGPVDLAVDPGAEAFFWGTTAGNATLTSGSSTSTRGFVSYLHLPLLVGANLGETATLVLSPGLFGAVAAAGTTWSAGSVVTAAQLAALGSGVGARLGLGINIRPSQSLSFQPEVTVLDFLGGQQAWLCMGGIGVNFGAQPDYSDMARADERGASATR